VLRIEADLLVPGRGAPIENGLVIIDDAMIAFAGDRASAPAAGAGDETVRVSTVMPGMWDCHGHFQGVTADAGAGRLNTPLVVHAARAAVDVEVVLQAGFTSVREVGGLGLELRQVVDEGILRGPSIYAAGSILSTTGGHGDMHEVPLAWMEDYCRTPGAMMHLCDGVPECLKGVRLQLRRGADLIKVCASGGVMSKLDDPIHQQFSNAELRAIVEEAAQAERIVAAHCHGKPGIMAALEAGCHTIEHGSYLDEEAATAMRERGAILVPTRVIVDRVRKATTGMHPESIRKMAQIADRHAEAVTLAIELGVRIAVGTDIATSARQRGGMPWGINGRELGLLVELGMTPLAAIEAATAVGPETLGPRAPRSGLLQTGYEADVIAVSGDPLDDIGLLAQPDCITHVWRGGIAVKQP
jgi:imidazolonepropionase-like amidohydrolase